MLQLILLVYKSYFIASLRKMVWYWYWHRIEKTSVIKQNFSEKDPFKNSQLTCDKV